MYKRYFNEKMETISLKELKGIQEKKLRRQVEYVYRNSRFYKEKFKMAGLRPRDIRTIDDLQKLPFTEKDELRESQARNPPLGDHACVSLEKVIRVHSSSGTTGTPSFVGITEHDREVWNRITARSIYTETVRPKDIVIHAAGLTFFVGGLPVKDAIEYIGATFVPIGTGASDRVVSTTRLMKANVLHCTPSYVMYLANYMREKLSLEPSDLGLEKIISGAEPGVGIPGVRKKIEEDYEADIREGLGNSDMAPIIFGECEEKKGMHFCAQEFIIPELIDPKTGETIEFEDNARGELVYTAIDRECVPLLRFRTRDHVVTWTEDCECGRSSFRLRCVGRTDDMLIVLGVNVFPSAVKDVLASMRPKTTGEIQILLDKPPPRVEPPLKIKVEYSKSFKKDLKELKREIEEEIRSKLVFKADVQLVPEGTLPRYEMKAKYVKKLYEE